MNNGTDPDLEEALEYHNLWSIQDCGPLTGPGTDRPAGGDPEWRGWPEPGPMWLGEAVMRTRWGRN